MKEIKAFTFIELLVTTSILIIMATSSVFYFFGFIDKVKLNTWIESVKSTIQELDKKVKNKDILDYKLFLKKNSLFMYYYSNTLNLNNILEYTGSIDYLTWSWNIEIFPKWTSTWALKIDIYSNNKFLKDFLILWDNNLKYWFSKFKDYKISATYSWQFLNDININYFAESNTNHKKQNYLKLIKIRTNKSSDLDSIYIKNILWRKIFSDNSSSIKLYLTFDVNWQEKTLEINK